MQQLMRDFLAILYGHCTVIFGHDVDVDAQQSARGLFKIDQLVSHAGYCLFYQREQQKITSRTSATSTFSGKKKWASAHLSLCSLNRL
jgi:hypothetical protein